MTKFSEHFGLRKSQAELDFVDIDIVSDLELYIDPYAFTTENDVWSAYCHHLIVTFFQAVIDSIKDGSERKALALLSELSEPSETHLGVSQEGSSGRGIGPKQASHIYNSLRNSAASKTGLLSDLSDFALFIPQIGRDKISDITTNVIRGPLIEYTVTQCRLYGIPTQRVPSGLIWNPDAAQWDQRYVHLPIVNGEKILLTPKYVVRYRVGVDAGAYRQHFVLNFLQVQHLHAGDGLVTAIKNAKGDVIKKVVYKKDLNKKYPDDKEFLAKFSLEYPEVIEKYRSNLKSQTRNLPNINPAGFSEGGLSQHLSQALKEIPTGREHANEYHNLMIGIISFLYYPHLIYPDKEFEINDGRKRIDIIYTNAKDSGFFYRLAQDQSIKATVVHVECKNYSNDIANPEFDQLVGRFSRERGKLGLMLYRSSEDQQRVIERCRDAYRAGNGLVIPMDDAFIHSALEKAGARQRDVLDRDLEMVFRTLAT